MNGLKLQLPRINLVVSLSHKGSGPICKKKVAPAPNAGLVHACQLGST